MGQSRYQEPRYSRTWLTSTMAHFCLNCERANHAEFTVECETRDRQCNPFMGSDESWQIEYGSNWIVAKELYRRSCVARINALRVKYCKA